MLRSHPTTETKKDAFLDADGAFVLRAFDEKRPFSNFLPGIAGLTGVPMWVFTVNRGQGVASFGTKNKDGSILEFSPANQAYRDVTTTGFRTFVKVRGRGGKLHFYEPFNGPADGAQRSMRTAAHELDLIECAKDPALEFRVSYFTVPDEPIAALARGLTIKNLGKESAVVELLDGLPQVMPFGMNEYLMKQMSNTIEAWMTVDNLSRRAPYFRLKVDAGDHPEVIPIVAGNFFFGTFSVKGGRPRAMDPVVDPAVMFGSRTDFSRPEAFLAQTPYRVPSSQIAQSKTPCAFGFASFVLGPGESALIRSYFGHAATVEAANAFARRAESEKFFDAKREENRRLIAAIRSRMLTVSGEPLFDQYCGQTFLDNVLRGGLPLRFACADGRDRVLHVYSRKHGDLERDYNKFLIEPSYFSQGDGNYRDVNQNRRNDPWFEPAVRDANVKRFLELIQLDGFNPLVVKGARFRYRRTAATARAVSRLFGAKGAAVFDEFAKKPFEAGALCRFLEDRGIAPRARFEKLFAELWPHLTEETRAEHGEGFWIDHWTYNLDLIESYLGVFPEDRAALLFDRRETGFFDNDHTVKPRAEKFVLKEGKEVRQYGAVARDAAKTRRLRDADGATLVRTRGGKGEPYRTTLFVKLLCLFANKLASLDARGAGIEMEADKPGWCDALNGLPGLAGSSLCETFELKRLAVFLVQSIDEAAEPRSEAAIPVELDVFLRRLETSLARELSRGGALPAGRQDPIEFWRESGRAKEEYRKTVKDGVSGRERRASLTALRTFLEHAREKLDVGIERACKGRAVAPTYFENRVTSFRKLPARLTEDGKPAPQAVEPLAFESRDLPLYLEGPVHALKVERDPACRRLMVRAVRESALRDSKLGMYKVNAPLNGAPTEIGRQSFFTPGWLENESIFLHMEYKFLLEILRAGLSEEFYQDFKKALVPFQAPERYGRSPLEHSSFIVSSAFPDASLHGGGFYARLSGSTAEFVSMWLYMNAGPRPFSLGADGKLSLRFEPRLIESLFTKTASERVWTHPDGEEETVKVPVDSYAFLFLGKTLVVYHNPRRLDTYGRMRASVKSLSITTRRGDRVTFKGDTVPAPHAARVRDERIPRIDVELG